MDYKKDEDRLVVWSTLITSDAPPAFPETTDLQDGERELRSRQTADRFGLLRISRSSGSTREKHGADVLRLCIGAGRPPLGAGPVRPVRTRMNIDRNACPLPVRYL